MKSPQETILKSISDFTIGADYAFEPVEYKKGNATREPADLVWACNNCIILMYMAHKKHKRREPAAHEQVRQSLIKHNLEQAKGWLTEWRERARKLVGKNRENNFNISYVEYKYKIILSVIDCGDNEVNYHPAETIALGVTACLTIPHNVLLTIIRIGGSILDVLVISEIFIKMQKDGIRIVDGAEIVMAYYETQLRGLGPSLDNRWFTTKDVITKRIHALLSLLRAPLPNTLEGYDNLPKPEGVPNFEFGRILNDFPLSNLQYLANLIREGIQKTGPKYEKSFFIGAILEHYYVALFLTVQPFTKVYEESKDKYVEFINMFSADQESKGFILIFWDIFHNCPVFVGSMLEGRSNQTTLAEEIAEGITLKTHA